MCGHPLEVTLKLNVSVPKISNLCQIQFWIWPFFPAFYVWSGAGVVFIVSTLDRLNGKNPTGTFFSPPKKKSWGPDCLYLHRCAVSPLWAASLLPEMRYLWKTVNISIHSMLAECVFGLPFHWSRLSLWLPAKIVAVHFGCLPVWIYGGVSLSKPWWLVWVAVAYCWVLCLWFLHYMCTTTHSLCLPPPPKKK